MEKDIGQTDPTNPDYIGDEPNPSWQGQITDIEKAHGVRSTDPQIAEKMPNEIIRPTQ